MLLSDPREVIATDRRQLLTTVLTAVGTAAATSPTADTADDQQLLSAVTAAYRQMEHKSSSRALIRPVKAHLGLIVQRLVDRPSRELHIAASETAGLAAWLFLDLEDTGSAHRLYHLAVREAHLSGHPLLPGYMQGSLGQFEAQSGAPGRGIGKIHEARRTLPKPTPALATLWLDVVESTALAEMRDEQALILLDSAERRLGRASAHDPVWPWLFRFDDRKLARYRAMVNARLGRVVAARRARESGPRRSQPTKGEALDDLAFAEALARAGEIDESCAVAVGALAVAPTYRSDRVLHQAIRLHSTLVRTPTAAVERLGQRLQACLEGTS